MSHFYVGRKGDSFCFLVLAYVFVLVEVEECVACK